MKEEIKKRIETERIEPNKQYEIPVLILLTGEVGSGKSLVAQLLSKELGLYLISGDYIRNIIFSIDPDADITTPENRALVNEVSLEELLYCIKKHYSSVLDRNVSSKEDIDFIKDRCNIDTILIKLISSDTENIKRVEQRKNKPDLEIDHYGHKETKSGVVTEEEYNKIKEKKLYDLEDNNYQYFLDTNIPLEELTKNIEMIADEIKRKI